MVGRNVQQSDVFAEQAAGVDDDDQDRAGGLAFSKRITLGSWAAASLAGVS